MFAFAFPRVTHGALRLAFCLAFVLAFFLDGLAARADDSPAYLQPDERQLRTHFICAESARVRPLDRAAIHVCSHVFQRLKIGFVPGMTIDRYDALSGEERARVNREGYMAWRAWVSANRDRVGDLRRAARTSLFGIAA